MRQSVFAIILEGEYHISRTNITISNTSDIYYIFMLLY